MTVYLNCWLFADCLDNTAIVDVVYM